MKRLFLLFSLFFAGLQATIDLPKPIVPAKPVGLSKKFLQKKAAVALIEKKKIKREKPSVQMKPSHLSDKTRNLAIFLHDEIIEPTMMDAIFKDFLESLIFPKNYTVFISYALIIALKNKYHFIQDLLNEKIDDKTLIRKYQDNFIENIVDITRLRRDLKRKIKSERSSTLFSSINGYMDELALIHRGMNHFFNSWIVYKTEHNFYVLISNKNTASSHFSMNTLHTPQALSSFIKADTKTENTTFSEDAFLADFKTLIKGHGKKIIPRPLNVFIGGHGLNEPGNEYMASLPQPSFKELTEFLTTTNTHSLFYSTCYGGGKNAVTTFDTELPYIVIAQGTTNTLVNTQDNTAIRLSSYFENINVNPEKALFFLVTLYGDTSPQKLIENDYKIRFPRTNWFTLAQMNTKLQTIGEIKSVTASLNQKPIMLSGKPCALLTPTLPTLALPKTHSLPLLMGLYPSQGDELYAFHEIIIKKEYDNIKQIIKALHTMFEQSYKIDERFYENAFYIKSLIVGERSFKNVLLYKNDLFIQYTAGEEDIVQADRNQIETKSFMLKFLTKEEASQTIFFKAIHKGKKQLEKYWEKVLQSSSVANKKPHSVDSDFAQLRQDLIEMKPEEFTEDVISDFKEEFSQASLSDAERTILESTLEGQTLVF